MYQRPVNVDGPRKMQQHFENFYDDLYEVMSKYGDVASLNIGDNLAGHMTGNVYVQFREERHAVKALKDLEGRFFASRLIKVDFSTVIDIGQAVCRMYDEPAGCHLGAKCFFMHIKKKQPSGYSGGRRGRVC